MEIQLDDTFTLKGKEHSWELHKAFDTGKVSEKTKKPIITFNDWHFSKLEHALARYANEAVKPCESMKEVLSKLDEVKKVIESVGTKLKKTK